MKTISIATEFSKIPGARYYTDGSDSGQEFREKFLEPEFKKDSNEPLLIDLDGAEGYATSFLEEAFGGLARIFGKSACNRLHFKSDEEPNLIEEIKGYIANVDKE